MQESKGKRNLFFYLILFFLLTSYFSNEKNIFPVFNIVSVEYKNNDFLEENIKNDIRIFLIGKSLLKINYYDLSAIFGKSDWVKNFKIYKRYPNKVIIGITEYQPIALYKNKNNEYYLVNNNFKITNKIIKKKEKNLNLIYVSGTFKKQQFSNIYLELIKSDIFSKINKLKLLNLDRSDLYLKNDTHVKLGVYDMQEQLNILYKITEKYKNVKYIDLRNRNKVIMR